MYVFSQLGNSPTEQTKQACWVVLPKHAIFNEQQKFVFFFTFGIIRIFKDILKGKKENLHFCKVIKSRVESIAKKVMSDE